jgi:hypothetical protein
VTAAEDCGGKNGADGGGGQSQSQLDGVFLCIGLPLALHNALAFNFAQD